MSAVDQRPASGHPGGLCMVAGGVALGDRVATATSRLLVTGREYSLTLSRARIAPGDAIVQFLKSGEDAHDL